MTDVVTSSLKQLRAARATLLEQFPAFEETWADPPIRDLTDVEWACDTGDQRLTYCEPDQRLSSVVTLEKYHTGSTRAPYLSRDGVYLLRWLDTRTDGNCYWAVFTVSKRCEDATVLRELFLVNGCYYAHLSDYSDARVGEDYACSKCTARGVKLWRQTHTFAENVRLLCIECLCASKGLDTTKVTQEGKIFDEASGLHIDQVGGLVPAIPTPSKETFWGYSAVPAGDVAWWKALPLRAGDG